MPITLDHPLTRRGCTCPLCELPKDAGLVVCWPCYRLWNFRNGPGRDVEALIDAWEAGLRP